MIKLTLITRHALHGAFLAAALLTAAGAAQAQAYPTRPVKLVVSGPPGGVTDVMARVLAEGMSPLLGQPVVIDNKTGAAGTIAVQELLKSAPDGYTMLVALNGTVSEVPHVIKVPYDANKALFPLVELGRGGLVLTGNPQVPATDLNGVIAYVKANPGKISYASYSAGTVSHTLGLQLNKLAGLDMLHVPYRGASPALNDVMAGVLPLMFDGPGNSLPFYKAGKVKVFAATAPSRMAIMPDVPTFAELGYKEMTEVLWIGLWTTPDVPQAIKDRVRETALKVLQDPKVRERYALVGMDVGGGTSSADLKASLQVASDKHAATLRSIGFKPE